MTIFDGNNDGDLLCYGSLSCHNSTIERSTPTSAGMSIQCSGDHSCLSSTINIEQDTEIYGAGSQSLKNATINVVGTNNLISLTGYFAGHDLKIIGQENSQFTINCYGNSCYNTFVLCNSTSTDINNYCDITIQCFSENLTNIDYNCPSTVAVGDPAIVIQSSTLTTTNLTGVEPIDPNIYDSAEMGQDLDKICNNNSIAEMYGDASENTGQGTSPTVDNNLCCSGEQSCYGATTWSISETDAFIVCSGDTACGSCSTIQTTGANNDVICAGESSCKDTNVIQASSSSNVYCSGTFSCKKVLIKYGDTIYCSGQESCYNTILKGFRNVYLLSDANNDLIINSSGVDVNAYFLGYNSGVAVNVDCSGSGDGEEVICNIFCYTKYSCRQSTVINCRNSNAVCNIYCDKLHGIGCGNITTGMNNNNVNIYNWSDLIVGIDYSTTGADSDDSISTSVGTSNIDTTITATTTTTATATVSISTTTTTNTITQTATNTVITNPVTEYNTTKMSAPESSQNTTSDSVTVTTQVSPLVSTPSSTDIAS